jgi:hypothetical protein
MMGVDLGTTNLLREATAAWRETGSGRRETMHV